MITENKYLITQEQLESIEHFQRMFEMTANLIQDLCNNEKDDIVYGFELGRMHSHLKECFMGMMKLESEIRSQPFKTKEKNE